jgi:hypothetical protein
MSLWLWRLNGQHAFHGAGRIRHPRNADDDAQAKFMRCTLGADDTARPRWRYPAQDRER